MGLGDRGMMLVGEAGKSLDRSVKRPMTWMDYEVLRAFFAQFRCVTCIRFRCDFPLSADERPEFTGRRWLEVDVDWHANGSAESADGSREGDSPRCMTNKDFFAVSSFLDQLEGVEGPLFTFDLIDPADPASGQDPKAGPERLEIIFHQPLAAELPRSPA